MVISTNPASSKGVSIASLNLVLFERPTTAIKSVTGILLRKSEAPVLGPHLAPSSGVTSGPSSSINPLCTGKRIKNELRSSSLSKRGSGEPLAFITRKILGIPSLYEYHLPANNGTQLACYVDGSSYSRLHTLPAQAGKPRSGLEAPTGRIAGSC